MRTMTFAVVIAALFSIQTYSSSAGELKTRPVVKPNPNLHIATPRCPSGSEIDRTCRNDAEQSAKGGKVDYSSCPCVKTVVAGSAPVINPPQLATAKVAPAPLIRAAVVRPTCTNSAFSSVTTCGGSCVDLRTDANNCGRCSNQCNATLTCQSGVCQCPAGQQQVSGTCVTK